MSALRNQSWIVLVGLIGCLHLMPGLHEASHDATEHSAEATSVSTVEVDCAACGLLSSVRQAVVASAIPSIVPLAPSERLHLPVGESRVQRREFAAHSPRAPPTA